jgi:hypothetical protein
LHDVPGDDTRFTLRGRGVDLHFFWQLRNRRDPDGVMVLHKTFTRGGT